MCVVVICFHCVNDAPLIVGANREEAYARGGTPPAVQPGPIPFVAGLDPVAGGTWLGVNAAGILVAVTNRKRKHLPPVPRSRGLLVRDLLASRSAIAAVETATRELATGHYAGCNLICADVNEAFVIEAGSAPRLRPLAPGPHVITTGDLDDIDDPRIRLGLESFAPATDSLDDLLAVLHRYLSTCDGPTPVCLHDGERGTVSSSIVVLTGDPQSRRFLHAQGSPDRVPHDDCSGLLAQFVTKDAAHRIRLRDLWQITSASSPERVRHVRRFGLPANLTTESVWLSFAGIEGTGDIHLNGTRIASDATGPLTIEVTRLLRPRNELAVDITAGGQFGEVTLEIRAGA